MSATPAGSTWHYGVTARWWAEFNTDGPEIAYFRQFVEAGQPALDVACGTGRLLLPYLRDGLDVDGCDVSPDMRRYCRDAAARDGLAPNLYAQAIDELELRRRYRTIYVCGALGWGRRVCRMSRGCGGSTTISSRAACSCSTTKSRTRMAVCGSTG
ncbi:MAG: class I SAM-dependent methyltransferase [Tepidiformaceae bacterium]